jgi:hypothetical protein
VRLSELELVAAGFREAVFRERGALDAGLAGPRRSSPLVIGCNALRKPGR